MADEQLWVSLLADWLARYRGVRPRGAAGEQLDACGAMYTAELYSIAISDLPRDTFELNAHLIELCDEKMAAHDFLRIPPVAGPPASKRAHSVKTRGRPRLSKDRLQKYRAWVRAWRTDKYKRYADCAAQFGANVTADDIRRALSYASKHGELFPKK